MKKIFLLFFCSFLNAHNINLNLDEAIAYALKNNIEQKISKIEIEVAKAKYEQAKSANYPKLDLSLTAIRKDETSNFRMKGELTLPNEISQSLAFSQILKQTGDISTAQALSSQINQKTNLFLDSNIEVLARDSLAGTLELTYPIYTGGKITSLLKQAELNKKVWYSNKKIKENELVFFVKELYYSYILNNKITNILDKSYEKFLVVNKLTKRLYQGDSLSVKKTDYLKTNLAVEIIKTKLIEQKANSEKIKNSLKVLLNIPNNLELNLLEKDFLLKTREDKYKNIFENSEELYKLKLAQKIYFQKIEEAKSSNYPLVAFFANTNKYYNSNDTGLNTDENKNSWNIGINLRFNIFTGFKTSNEILENRLKLRELEEKEELLKNSLDLNLQNILIDLDKNLKSIENLKRVNSIAIEHRNLNINAYKIEMAETKDVLEAQEFQTRSEIMFIMAQYKYLITFAKLEKLFYKGL